MTSSPSDLHQGLIDLVRGDPVFAIELVYRAATLLPFVRLEVRDLGTDLRVVSPFGQDRHLRPDIVAAIHGARHERTTPNTAARARGRR